MAEKLICKFRVVNNPEGVWLETSYPKEGTRTKISEIPCGRYPVRPWLQRMKDRSQRGMRKSLDFLEGMYNDLYGNVEK